MSDNGYISIDNRPYVCLADAGTKITAAIADLPPTGGIVDARSLWGAQDITVNLFSNIPVSKQITLLLGAAHFRVTTTQILTSLIETRVIGTATSGEYVIGQQIDTTFLWNGPSDGTVFLFSFLADCEFENFSIVPGTSSIGIGIRIDQAVDLPSASDVLSTKNIFKTISIHEVVTGVQIGNDSTYNNDLHEFHNVAIVGPDTHGYYINNSQSKFIH